MKSPSKLKELQQLTGRLAALNRFLPKADDKCHHFFTLIKNWGRDFSWTEEYEKAFQDLKLFLQSPPVMAKPVCGEILYVYLSLSSVAGSSVLCWEDKGIMKPV